MARTSSQVPKEQKTRTKKKRITFELPAEAGASETVEIAGEFNGWDPTPLKRRKDGRFSVTLSLESGRSYRYRYLIDGSRWENDWDADEYLPNGFGGEDSVIHL